MWLKILEAYLLGFSNNSKKYRSSNIENNFTLRISNYFQITLVTFILSFSLVRLNSKPCPNFLFFPTSFDLYIGVYSARFYQFFLPSVERLG